MASRRRQRGSSVSGNNTGVVILVVALVAGGFFFLSCAGVVAVLMFSGGSDSLAENDPGNSYSFDTPDPSVITIDVPEIPKPEPFVLPTPRPFPEPHTPSFSPPTAPTFPTTPSFPQPTFPGMVGGPRGPGSHGGPGPGFTPPAAPSMTHSGPGPGFSGPPSFPRPSFPGVPGFTSPGNMTPGNMTPGFSSTPGSTSSITAPQETRDRGESARQKFDNQTAPNDMFLLGLNVNVHGAEIIIQDQADGSELEKFVMGALLFESRTLSPRNPVKVTVKFGKESKTVDNVLVLANDKRAVDLNFDNTQLLGIQKQATCLINIPDGGFGSGFLFQDRLTIATAAHCVVAEKIEDLEFVFDPTEPTEEKVKGARLMHYDKQQDIALLRLPQPMPEHRPYYHRGVGDALEGDDVLVVGNPGRQGKPDPTYYRSGKVEGDRADEFFLDVELLPGFSGGPVVLKDSNQAVGVVSYKIIKSDDYKELGRSYAKSADLIGDAYEHFTTLSELGQVDRLARLGVEHDHQYVKELAGQAALDMYIDSSVYLQICATVAVDYIEHMAQMEANMNPNLPLVTQHKVRKKAHEDYLKENAPEIAKRVRDKVSPRLRMAESNSYDRALKNERLDESMRKSLESAHETYAQLKEAAEQIVQPNRSAGNKGRNLEEFLNWVVGLYRDTRTECFTVLIRSGVQIEE